MQLANVMLAIGDDHNYTVPKYGVTPGEVAALIAIHGESAVFEIDVLDATVERSSREERQRLIEIYGNARDGEDKPIVPQLFPGAAARVFEEFAELGLEDSAFTPASLERVYAAQKPAKPAAKRGKAKKGAEVEPEAEGEDEDEDDGIGDMPATGNAMG